MLRTIKQNKQNITIVMLIIVIITMLCFEFKEDKANYKELKYSDCFLLLAKDQDQDLFEQCKKVVKMQLSNNEIKIYKTIEIEGNSSGWDVTVITDLDRGHIDNTSFLLYCNCN